MTKKKPTSELNRTPMLDNRGEVPTTGGPRATSQIMRVTPAMAREWLEKHNHRNRTINRENVRRLAAAMSAGTFVATNQGIGFDADGNLIDGQHRLTAIIESGVTVEMLVVHGLPADARAKVDIGYTRSLAQILHMVYGLSNTSRVLSWLHAIEHLEADAVNTRLTPDEALAMWTYHRDAIDWALTVFGTKRVMPAAVVGALVYARPTDPPGTHAFASSVADGANLAHGAPALALRNIALTSGAGRGVDRRVLSLKTLRALLAHTRGESLSILRPSEEWLAHFAKAHAGRK